MTSHEKYALLTPENMQIVCAEIQRLLKEQATQPIACPEDGTPESAK